MKKALLSLAISTLSITAICQTTYKYEFANNLNDKLGQGTALAEMCTGSYATETLPVGVSKTVYSFDKGCGLVFDDASTNLLSSGSYTIELYFKLDTISSYKKIIDYDSLGSDKGFYNRGGKLNLYPNFTSTDTYITAGQYQYVAITRNATTKEMYLYYNDQVAGNYTDNAGDYVYGSDKKLVFFRDDNNTNGEHSSGKVAMIHISDNALDSNSVKSNYTQLPATLNIHNAKVLQSVKVYPIPANDHVSVTTSKNGVYSISSLIGNVLKTGTLNSGNNNIDISSIATGIYILKVETSNGKSASSFKLIKQ